MENIQSTGMAFRCRADAALSFESVDLGSKRVCGYISSELVETGMISLPDLIQPEERETVRKQIQDSIARKGVFAIPFGLQGKDHRQTRGVLVGKGIFGGPLSLKGIEGYIVRLHDSNTTGRTGETSEIELFRQMLDSVSELIAVITQDGIIQDIAGSVQKILGYHPDEIIGKSANRLFQALDKTRFEDLIPLAQEIGTEGISANMIASSRTGDPILLEIRMTSTGDSEGRLILAASITSEEKTELTTPDAMMPPVFTSAPVPMAITGLKDRLIQEVNQAFLDICGQSDPADLIGVSLTGAGLVTRPDELIGIEASLDRNGEAIEVQSRFRTPSGIKPVLISARSIMGEGIKPYQIVWTVVILPEVRIPSSEPSGVQDTGAETVSVMNHRFKNYLLMLESVMRLKGMKNGKIGADAIKESRMFMHAISAYYQKINPSVGSDTISVCAYMQSIASNIDDEYQEDSGTIPIQVTCDENFLLPGSEAVPMGIILTELIINAISHAYEPSERGTIAIIFRREEDWYILEVNDNGRGLPDAVMKGQLSTTGLSMVENLAHQLSGTAGFSNEKGARIRILFPVPRT
ncbi:MAG TPA: PAS domain S-box protein [Methanospirillum sp.]|nr:PAS domain S-box protein [Methanospirillum sp.]